MHHGGNMKSHIQLLLAIALVVVASCDSPQQLVVQDWQHTEIEYCKPPRDAWLTCVDVLLSHDYQLQQAHFEDGFLRSDWQYHDYIDLGISIRTRFIVNFLPYRAVVRVTPEIEYFSGSEVLKMNIPIVAEVLNDMDRRLRCLGDEPSSEGTSIGGKPPATKH